MSLDLSRTQITDAGIRSLGGLKKLTSLEVTIGNGVTPQGVTELKKAIPACEVRCWDLHGIGLLE